MKKYLPYIAMAPLSVMVLSVFGMIAYEFPGPTLAVVGWGSAHLLFGWGIDQLAD